MIPALCIGCVGGVVFTIVGAAIAPFVLWALGFVDMGMNPQRPNWLRRGKP